MSHRHQRKEKICLNCGAEVIGKFCHDCGQENAEPKETIWHLIQHFVSDLTHFDGKLWHTAKFLLFKPGFLSVEYLKGKRARYVNPVNLYFFTSAIFFLVFSSVFESKTDSSKNELTVEKIDTMNTVAFHALASEFAPGRKVTAQQLKDAIDSSRKNGVKFGFTKEYASRAQFDSLERAGKGPGWIRGLFIKKFFDLNDRYKNNSEGFKNAILEKFLHSLPKMLFVLLPLFAAILKLLYIRRRQFYYVDHMIFTLHLYIFIFVALLVIFGLDQLQTLTSLSIFNYLVAIVWILILFYFYKALRVFYHQSRIKTIVKLMILSILVFTTSLVLFTVFMIFSILQL